MLLHEHPGFQSDIVLVLETVGASLIIGKLSFAFLFELRYSILGYKYSFECMQFGINFHKFVRF